MATDDLCQTPTLKAFSAWVRSNGGFIHDGLVLLAGKSPCSSACYATTSIPPSAKLLSIPSSLAITYSVAAAELPSLPPNINHYAALSAFLALERLKGRNSFWHPYIATLPPVELGCGGPMFQNLETLNLYLAGTNLGAQEVENVKEDWRQDWKSIKEFLDSVDDWREVAEGLTWELYLWAASIFSSRSFPDSLLKWGCPLVTLPPPRAPSHNIEGANVQPQNTEGTDSQPALFPLLDVLNHKPRTKITWQLEELGISFTGEEWLYEGTEVFNNYGPKPNQQLFLSYGFTIQNNPDDSVLLKLNPPLDPVRAAIRREQIDIKDDNGIYYLTARCPTPPTGLLQLFRIMVANELELEILRNYPKHSIMGRNELAAKTQILRSLCGKCKNHIIWGPAEEEDETTEPTFKRYATIFRKGQIGILEAAISRLETEIAELCSLYKLYTSDNLAQPFRKFRWAIENCFGDSEDQVESGMDQVVYILAICNALLEHQAGHDLFIDLIGRLLKHYPMGVESDEEEEARIQGLYEDVIPAAANLAPEVFDDKRWSVDLLRWGARVYQEEVVKVFKDGGEKDFLIFAS